MPFAQGCWCGQMHRDQRTRPQAKENGLYLSFKLYGTKQFQMWFCSACETRVFDIKAYM